MRDEIGLKSECQTHLYRSAGQVLIVARALVCRQLTIRLYLDDLFIYDKPVGFLRVLERAR